MDKDGSYKLVLVCQRFWHDDGEVCESAGTTPVEQLAREIQECYDSGAAGLFEVYEVPPEMIRLIEATRKPTEKRFDARRPIPS